MKAPFLDLPYAFPIKPLWLNEDGVMSGALLVKYTNENGSCGSGDGVVVVISWLKGIRSIIPNIL